ncbi:MAG: site-specific DNA-methyltransferase [Flammeovirgaceae bacterium]
MPNKQKITNEIKTPNNDLEILRKHFPHCFDKNGKFDVAKFQKQLDSQNIELTFEKESYGLDWLGKSYARLLASDPATTLLKANEIHNTQPENANSENLLIKGDNLEVLKHLANAYYEKVKMIYIDPPYNTGSDGFVYNDDRKYTVKELQNLIGIDEEKAKRILSFTQSKSNSHSAWLTFMYPRLYIAKQLLREDGVIFVSIDDNEVAQLRLLMDEIFGEENFVAEFVWTGKSGSEDDSHIRNNKEYIICFSKTIHLFQVGLDEKKEDKFNYFDPQKNDYYKRQLLRKWGDNSRREDRPNLYYSIKDDDGNDFYPTLPNGEEGCWRWAKDKMQKAIAEGRIEFVTITNGRKEAYEKIYQSEERNNTKKYQSILQELGSSSEGTKEIKFLFEDKKVFSNPKPTKLLKQLALIANTNKSDLIIDFFAGSGTTGDAVMQLNAEDGGNRKFILVQLPEPIDPKKNKTAYDFVKNELKAEPTIFEITKERLLRAAKKIKTETIDKKIAEKEKEIKELQGKLDFEDKEEKIKQLKAEIKSLKEQDLGFKIFETIPIWEDYNFEAEQFDSFQTLFDVGKLTEDDIKALLITWKTYDGIPLTQDLETVDLSGYTTYYGSGKLYLMHKRFTTDNLKALLEKIDSDKHFEPKTIIAFGYHFESARLRELAENVKTYNNKKKTDIDFIIRY